VLVAVLLSQFLAGPGGSVSAFQAMQMQADWNVVAVGPRERSLDLIYTSSGCLGPGVHVTVSEARASVTVRMQEDAEIPGPGEACAEFLRLSSLQVALAAPLRGRAILGRPTADLPIDVRVPDDPVFVHGRELIEVPRLIGFAPREALRALALRALSGDRRFTRKRGGGLPRVVEQSPAPGATIALHGVVRLRIASR
jgi:hypothetical protein